jgi:hybrid cluster-associated redox disulfide protein
MKKYPGTIKTMKSLGLDCPSCKGAKRETVLEAARTHGLEPKTLLNELKKAAGKK